MDKNRAVKTYVGLRLFSALFFAVIVTVNLVYQATVVGLGPLQLVLVGTLLETVTFLFEIPTGIVADLYSRKLSVMIGVFLIGLGFVIEGAVPAFTAVLLAQIVWGIGFTFVSGAREAWIADEVGEEKPVKHLSAVNKLAKSVLLWGLVSACYWQILTSAYRLFWGVFYTVAKLWYWLW